MRWEISSKIEEKKDLITLLLKNRGLKTQEEVETFLNPPPILELTKGLPEEFKEQARKTKDLIMAAIAKDIPIVIFGDYDADGICATAILHKTIKTELNHKKTFSFIPNRFEHGYGITNAAIDEITKRITKKLGEFEKALMITVDTGITAVEETNYAIDQGYTVVITDHHQKPDELPEVEAIIWCDQVVGAGVSWILSKLLGSKDKTTIGLAALATVTDLQPLFGYNRAIVKEGLKVLNNNPPLGLKALRQVADKKGEVTTYDLGWVFGPRLNAAGRIGDADDALILLLEEDMDTALIYANKLNDINVARQDKTVEMYELAGEIDLESPPKIIVSSHKDYHEGIIGLVAAKLMQKHYRPAIVISLENGIGKGSVRSVKGVNIIEFLRNFEDMFDSLGGHPMAAGFSIKEDLIEDLISNINGIVDEHVLDEHLEPVLSVDMEIPLHLVGKDLAEELNKLKPFGIGNRSPVFASKSVGVSGVNTVGRTKDHMTLQLVSEGKTYKAIYFGGAEHYGKFGLGDFIDVAYSIELKEFRGKEYLNLVVKDICY